MTLSARFALGLLGGGLSCNGPRALSGSAPRKMRGFATRPPVDQPSLSIVGAGDGELARSHLGEQVHGRGRQLFPGNSPFDDCNETLQADPQTPISRSVLELVHIDELPDLVLTHAEQVRDLSRFKGQSLRNDPGVADPQTDCGLNLIHVPEDPGPA